MDRLPEMAEIAKEVRTKMWSLFFLIVTGRALENDDLAAAEYEQVFEFMYKLSKTAPFGIKTTEAMHYRRYVAQRIKAEHGAAENENARGVAWRTAGVSDGKGFVFVSHTGEIFPSGFLPVSGGNVLRRFADGRLPQLGPVPHPARYQPARRQVRPLRIPEDLRRLALPRLCPHRRLPGRRPALHLSAAPGGSHRGVSDDDWRGVGRQPFGAVLPGFRPACGGRKPAAAAPKRRPTDRTASAVTGPSAPRGRRCPAGPGPGGMAAAPGCDGRRGKFLPLPAPGNRPCAPPAPAP